METKSLLKLIIQAYFSAFSLCYSFWLLNFLPLFILSIVMAFLIIYIPTSEFLIILLKYSKKNKRKYVVS